MAKLNTKQRKIMLHELEALSRSCKFNMGTSTFSNNNMAYSDITEVLRILNLLNEIISVHEFIVCTKSKSLRDKYQQMIDDNASPGQYQKKGYGPNHGKGSKKKKV